MKRFAVIGDPVSHSLSPQMHNAAFKALGLNAEYSAIHVKESELADFAAGAGKKLDGFNITVPHKNAIIPFLDNISCECRMSGSVNTVKNENGFLRGESTDGYGLATALKEQFGIELEGSNFIFLGAGGTVLAVTFYFAANGAAGIFIANRTLSKAQSLIGILSKKHPGVEFDCASPDDRPKMSSLIKKSSVIIQCTSLGLKSGDPSPLSSDLLTEKICVYDTIYRKTAFIIAAGKKGCRCADGRSMLLHQGAKSFSIWTGLDAPVEPMRMALDEALRKRIQ